MMRPSPKGWCPGAHRPMRSGDGLIYRIRPRHSRIDAVQLAALCHIARTFGNGMIDLTRRANLQIRGVGDDCHDKLLADLRALDLMDETAEVEARRNITTTPFWQPDDLSDRIASELEARLTEFPPLPAKFGFAVDTGPEPLLQCASADIRFEHGKNGGLIVRADGSALGQSVEPGHAVDCAIALASWFHETGGNEARRMHRHLDTTDLPEKYRNAVMAVGAGPPDPGQFAIGPVFGAPFGQLPASVLANIVAKSGAVALRTTPWRLFILEGGQAVATDHFIATAGDPLLDVDACPGAPYCPSASVGTRAAARRLAQSLIGGIHVSGCNKGCASPVKVKHTFVGRDGRFDFVRDGCPWDEPEMTGLDPQSLPDLFRKC